MARLLVILCVAAPLWACTSVRVHTVPEDADIEADGEDLSEDGELKDRIGFKDHEVTVRARGYKPKTVVIPRTGTNTAIKIASLVGSLGCASISACAACGVGALLGNSVALPTFAGACLAGFSGDPVSSLSAALVAATSTQDILTVPCMGLCTLLGSWPLLGMLIPIFFPRSPSDVTIELERDDAPADPPPPIAAPAD